MAGQDDTFIEFVCDQLEGVDCVTHKAMFGGHGLYCGSTFFGIVYKGTLYFKTDEATRRRYEKWGSAPFQPNARQTLKSYYEVPAELLDDAVKLVDLAEEAVDVAAQG